MAGSLALYGIAVAVVVAASALMCGTSAPRDLPARPDVVVDDDDPGFTTTDGGWHPSTRDPGFHGRGYQWHAAGTGEAAATWRADLPRPGRYNVYARWVMSKPDDRATNAPFTVAAVTGPVTVRVNMAEKQSAAEFPAGRVQSAWNLLGTFPFKGRAEVTLTNQADNSVVADAVRFEYMESLDAALPARGKLLFSDDCDRLDQWVIEGSAGRAEIVGGALRVTSTHMKKGVHAWFRPDLPDHVRIEYDMTIHGPKGFALTFFCAHGSKGEDILTGLPARDGLFGQYVGDERFQCYHFSVHRQWGEVSVEGANLNRNPPKTLIQRHAVDPCPGAPGDQTYHMTLVKMGGRIQLLVNERPVFFCYDPNSVPYKGGKFGFRQIYLSEISYDNLRVYEAVEGNKR